MKECKMVCLTGGPCGGKTTLVARCMAELPERGVRVLIAPEAATQLISNMGIRIGGVSVRDFQVAVSKMQKFFEDTCLQAADRDQMYDKTLILCDRGMLDNLAYISEEEYKPILKEVVTASNVMQAAMMRYDAVIHIVTAADGAVEHYNLGNAARTETPEQAVELDKACLKAWSGHPHLGILDNSESFEAKMNRGMQMICDILGIPAPIERERKYLLKKLNRTSIPAECMPVDVEITQTYLKSIHELERRVRSRTYNGETTYFYTTKRHISGLERVENERVISEEEYSQLLMEADRSLRPIRKTRTCFCWDHQRFELDNFPTDPDFSLLEIELLENDTVRLPDFVKEKLLRDVTDNSGFRNASIAARDGVLARF